MIYQDDSISMLFQNRISSTEFKQNNQSYSIQLIPITHSSINLMPKKYGKRRQTLELHDTELYDKVTKLQSQIISDLEYLNRKRNDKYDCAHCYQQAPLQYDPTKNYSEQFWKAYLINCVCLQRYNEYRDYIRKIDKRINNVERVYEERKQVMLPIESKKRRRNASHPEDEVRCEICGKRYKDQISLGYHVELKHQDKKDSQEINFNEAKMQEIHPSFIENNSRSEQNYYEEDE